MSDGGESARAAWGLIDSTSVKEARPSLISRAGAVEIGVFALGWCIAIASMGSLWFFREVDGALMEALLAILRVPAKFACAFVVVIPPTAFLFLRNNYYKRMGALQEEAAKAIALPSSPSPVGAHGVFLRSFAHHALDPLERTTLRAMLTNVDSVVLLGFAAQRDGDASWTANLEDLVRSAAVVFVNPAASAESFAAIAACIGAAGTTPVNFLAPPAEFPTAESQLEGEQRWQKIVNGFAAGGIELPPFSSDGAIFRLDSTAQGSVATGVEVSPARGRFGTLIEAASRRSS